MKREEIYANQYQDLDDLRTHLTEFLEDYYNRVRLHSAMDYHSSAEFEAGFTPTTASNARKMSFFRHQEVFPSDVETKVVRERTCLHSSVSHPKGALHHARCVRYERGVLVLILRPSGEVRSK